MQLRNFYLTGSARVVTTGGPGGPWPPPPQFTNHKRSKSFSFKHKGYCFLPMFRKYTNQKFYNFYRLCYNFWTIYSGFSFVLTIQGKQITSCSEKVRYLTLGLLKSFFFLDHLREDHNQRQFKPQIIAGILDLPKQSSKAREASIISGPQLI